jgi:hypothetical protein
MIRMVAVVSLVGLLILVLYLPAARQAPAFMAQIRAEHEAMSASWGKEHALRMLERMLDLQPQETPRAPMMPREESKTVADTTVNHEVAAIGNRLLNNEYFRSLNALLLLATYRFAVLLHLLPAMAPFLIAAIVDGLVRRSVKSIDFSGHHPEIFSVCASGIIVAACCMVVAFVIPTSLPPVIVPALLAGISILTNIGIANYHKRA